MISKEEFVKILDENKSAKEMFEDLEYKLRDKNRYPQSIFEYRLGDGEICFLDFGYKKSVSITCPEIIPKHNWCHLDMEELKAINKQIEELGW